MSPTPRARPLRNAKADPNGTGRDPLGLESVWAILGLDGGGWHRRALCIGRTEPTDHWFAEPRHDAKRRDGWAPAYDVAVAHCMECPVAEPCLRSALTPVHRWTRVDDGPRVEVREAAEYGIFAGTTPGDRRGKTIEDAPALLAMARARAIERGLAPKPHAKSERKTSRSGAPLDPAEDTRGLPRSTPSVTVSRSRPPVSGSAR